VALGAFLAGMLVAESGAGKRVGDLIAPLRDVFASVFFVSVGMLLDPSLVIEHIGAVIALFLVVLFGRAGALFLGAFLSGHSLRDAVRAGLLLAQIGEFSFIIAALGVQSGAVGAFLYPVAVAVAVLAALVNPWLVRAAPSLSVNFERILPERLQTFASLYTTWLEGWRGRRDSSLPRRRLMRMGMWLGVDLILLCGVIVSAAIWFEEIARLVVTHVGLGVGATRAAIIGCTSLASLPFLFGALRLAERMGRVFAESALPLPGPTKPDPGYTPRRALAVAMQFLLVLVSGLCVQAVTQPFVRPLGGWVVLCFVLATLGISLWRRADELEGHVQAGAQVIAAALTRKTEQQPPPSIEDLELMLPGIGHLVMLGLAPQSAAVGVTLGELELSGASVVAIERDGVVITQPEDEEVLRRGDVLALSGSQEAVRDAAMILARPKSTEFAQDLRNVRAT
jgi:CPA2 family monovalent cation:H+ antiporter-2